MDSFRHQYLKHGFLRLRAVVLCLAVVIGFVTGPAHARVIVATPDTYRSLLGSLQPGDTLRLEAGTYARGLPVSNLHGEAGRPIVITGPESGAPAVFPGSVDQAWNTVQINNSSYLTFRNLKLDGLDVPYIDAVNAGGITHHITLENLEIVRHGAHQLTVGIATRGPAWDWVIRNCRIIGAGTGMYLGHWQGRNWPFVGGLIENNLFVDSVGYNVQIKQMNSRGYESGDAIPGMPLDDRKTIIRHNVFSKASQPSPPTEGARPNLLVGHFPLTGPGSNDVYEIYGNFFYQNTTEALFQGEGNIAFYDNVMVNDAGSAVHIQPHNDVPRSIDIFHNTIVATGNGIRIQGASTDFVQRVVGNAVFAGSPLSAGARIVQRDNVTDGYAAAGDYLLNPGGSIAAGELDLFPRAGRLSGAVVDLAAFQGFTDAALDFNGSPRDGSFRGAYAGDGVNRGWSLATDIKPGVDAVPLAPSVFRQPASVTVQEGEVASFDIGVSGSGPPSYQWRRDGVAIAGATAASYRTAVTRLADNGAVYDCVVSNAAGSVTSEGAVLTVLGDAVAPSLVSANASGASLVTVTFSEPVARDTAETVANYRISPAVDITAAALDETGERVRLSVNELLEAVSYTLSVSDIEDRAASPNTIAPGSSVVFSLGATEDFEHGDAPAWEALTPSRWSVVRDGDDMAYFLNTTDYRNLSGDRLGEYSLLPGVYADFTMTLNARMGDAVSGNAQADFAIVFGYRDANNYYYMMFNYDAGFTGLFEVAAGARRQVAAAGRRWIGDNLYHAVKLRRRGDEVTVWLDGETVLAVTLGGFPSGRVGVGSFNDAAYFDDVRVDEIVSGAGVDAGTDTGVVGGGGGAFGLPAVLVLLMLHSVLPRRGRTTA